MTDWYVPRCFLLLLLSRLLLESGVPPSFHLPELMLIHRITPHVLPGAHNVFFFLRAAASYETGSTASRQHSGREV